MSKLVENYLLQQPIGKGVYGQVYRAVHQKSKQVFAVKVIPKASFRSNPKLEQLAINEINILSSLRHQHIVRFIQTLKTPNNFYFVYEYCNEGTIENLIQKKKFLKQNQALIIFRQLLQAFKELNKNNIMHRDLKPDNIFLNNNRVKLGDFGFCKMLQVNMAQTMLGSPIYMAPEILKQQIYTSKADIWSLGVVLFQLLFGYCPYQSSSISQLINVIRENQLSIPKEINYISDKTQNLLRKMLVKDQFKRIQWVDLFQYQIDQMGNIIEGYNKQMGIQALQKYFLHDLKSVGEIVIGDSNSNSSDPYLELKSEQSGKQKISQIKDQAVPSLKKALSNDKNTGNLLKSESLGKAGPGSSTYDIKQFTYKNSDKQNMDLKQKQKQKKQPLLKQKKLNHTFLQKHSIWLEALQVIEKLSQRGTTQTDKCIFWLATQLQDRLNNEYKNYPQWTDVIMQQKQQISLMLKQLENIQINKQSEKKIEILKIWSKSNSKGDKIWDKAIRFIFAQQHHVNRSAEDILYS